MSLIPICPLLALVLAAPAFAVQNDASAHLRPIPAPVRDGGTLHLADGSWTRATGSASLGHDVLYDNTCLSSFYGSLSGDTYVDEGRIPGLASPDNLSSKPGCATSYSVDGFQIGYCTQLPTASFNYAFYSNYTTCTPSAPLTPVGSFALTGLPGSPSEALLRCWTVNVDASGTPFLLDASGPGTKFGFAMSSPQSSFTHGPIIAGNPNSCLSWDGTSWDPSVNLAESGTGMGTEDQFYIEGGATIQGCYYFGPGGDPFASYWLELYGTTCAPEGSGQAAFCIAGSGATALCPCANNPAPGVGGGCTNSFGLSGRLVGSGTPSLANDTVVLSGSQMPVASSVLYFQGTLRHNAGLGQSFGDGLRCAGGGVLRLGSAINSGAGTSQYPSGFLQSVSVRGGVTDPGTRTYQAWYRNVAAFCTPAAFNTTNGWEISWGA